MADGLTLAQEGSHDPFTSAPGKQTSEYAATVMAQFLSALVAVLAVLSPGFDIDGTTQAVIVGFATSTLTLSQMVYAWTRSRVKQASAQASAMATAIPATVVEKAETVIATSPLTNDSMGQGAIQ